MAALCGSPAAELSGVRRQRSWERLGFLSKGGSLVHRNLQGGEDETEIRALNEAPDKVVKDIRRATRKRHSPEEGERSGTTGSSETANPHCAERAEGRGRHRRAVPPLAASARHDQGLARLVDELRRHRHSHFLQAVRTPLALGHRAGARVLRRRACPGRANVASASCPPY